MGPVFATCALKALVQIMIVWKFINHTLIHLIIFQENGYRHTKTITLDLCKYYLKGFYECGGIIFSKSSFQMVALVDFLV